MLFTIETEGLTATATRTGPEEAAGRRWYIRWGDSPVWSEAGFEEFPPALGESLTHTYDQPGDWQVELYSPSETPRDPVYFQLQVARVAKDHRPEAA